MRGFEWVLLLAFLCAPAWVAAAVPAPMMAFLSPRSSSSLLRAPESEEGFASPGPIVAVRDAISRLTHQRDSEGVPDLCGLEKIVHVQVDSLHDKSFASLSSSSSSHSLKKRVLTAPQQLVFPMMDQTSSSFSEELVRAIESLCGSARSVKDRVMSLHFPDLTAHESSLVSQLSVIDTAYPEHVVIISSTPPHRVSKRSVPSGKSHGSKPAKFLERYQIFSPATVLSLLVVAFLLFCTVIAVNMISSTQAPDRLGTVSRNTSYDKKRN